MDIAVHELFAFLHIYHNLQIGYCTEASLGLGLHVSRDSIRSVSS